MEAERLALLEAELSDLKEENRKLYKMLKKNGNCDWCIYAELYRVYGEFGEPCIDCISGSKFIPDYQLLEN